MTAAELVCVAVMQAVLGFVSERRWLRYVRKNLPGAFPDLPQQPGYNKRLRSALPLIKRVLQMLAADTDVWHDTVWITDSTPGALRHVPAHRAAFGSGRMGRLRLLRLPLAVLLGGSGSTWCATPSGMPILWALANPKIDEREVPAAMLQVDADLVADRPGLLLVCDKGVAAQWFEAERTDQHITVLRPSRKDQTKRFGEPMPKAVRQLIESVNDTLKGQLDLGGHGGRTFEGVAVRVAQRVPAMAAAIWHNHRIGAPVTRSLIAYDH